MTTLAILTAARALVAKGWCQREYFVNGKCCSLGALREITGDWVEPLKMITRANNTIGDIIVWNDAPGRTQAEVLDAFTAAIELARKEQTK